LLTPEGGPCSPRRCQISSVDVIVPCYRYGRFLCECVESVLSQQIQSLRVLIIDDASPDNTAEAATALASEDSRVEFVRHKTNAGHIATYNEGIEWAGGDYFPFFRPTICCSQALSGEL